MLPVGSLEYQYGRADEAMNWFLKLTSLPAETEDLVEIIDRAGDFLIDQDDLVRAAQLYSAAACAYPEVALYHVGLGYCLGKAGQLEESVEHHRAQPSWNRTTTGTSTIWATLSCKRDDTTRQKKCCSGAVELAPPDYDLARGNLEHLRKVRGENA